MSLNVSRIPVALAGAALALGLPACGSSSKAHSSSSTASQFVAFARCMRAHGVTDFPDPRPGGGIKIAAGSGIQP